MNDTTFARWGTPPRPIELSDDARAFLSDHVGSGKPLGSVRLADIPVPDTRLPGDALGALGRIVGNSGVTTSAGDRVMHATGCSLVDYLHMRAGGAVPIPDAVVRPGDHDSVEKLLSYCSDKAIPVVPFGGGTSVVGGTSRSGQPAPWICIAMDRMTAVLSIDELSQCVTVQPGITGPELEAILKQRGFTLGHIPQSWERATIGGYVATRSAGQSSTGYGRSDEMVESLRVATPVGALSLGRGPKTAAGPDLRQVFIGSEGALGIITEVTLRIRRLPTTSKYEGLMFPSFEQGVAAFREMAQTRATADVMRLSDGAETATTLAMSGPKGRLGTLFERYLSMRNVTGGCLAILGWEGQSRRLVAARRQAAWTILRANGAASLGGSVGSSWLKHRFDGPYLRDALLDAGYIVETLETAAHYRDLSRLHDAVATALRTALSRGAAMGGSPPMGHSGAYVMCHVSHVYETGASLYFTAFAAATDDPVGQWLPAKRAATDAMIANGGTITHHHAVGRDHAPWLSSEIGLEGVRVLRGIKATVDPSRVMNPGVLLSED